MTDQERLEEFVQDVYLTRNNRFIDDITDEDGLIEVAKTVRWANMYLDELEAETDTNGFPINWNFMRENEENLGTVSSANQVLDVDDDVLRLVVDDNRPLVLKQGDSSVSWFDVVDADQITNRSNDSDVDRVAKVGTSLVFSRPFRDYEIGAKVYADTIHSITRFAQTPVNVDALDLIKPYQLLVLGVAKNSTLPDIVQGGLSPSFTQKYGDLLENAIAANAASSAADTVAYDDYSAIGGIY